MAWLKNKQGRIHGYRSRVQVGRGQIWGHQTIWAGAVRSEYKIHKKSKIRPTNRQTDRWTKRVVESHARDLTTRFVSRSVGYTLLFCNFISLSLLLLPKWSGDLKHGPCPPTRDFGSRVSGLVHLEMTFFQSWGRIIKNLLKLHLTLGTCFSVVFSPI